MSKRRRIAFLVASILIVTVVTAITATAAGGGAGCGLGPGQCTSEDVGAGASLTSSDGNLGIQLDVTRTDFVFRPRPGSGGTPVVLHETQLDMFISGFSGGQFVNEDDCFVIPDSDFVAASDGSSATLNTNLQTDAPCGGPSVPLAVALGAIPAAGCCAGGGGGSSLLTNIEVAWTGSGATTTNVNDGQSHCTGVTTTSHFAGATQFATETGAAVMVDTTTLDLSGQFGFVQSFRSLFNEAGVPAPACIGA